MTVDPTPRAMQRQERPIFERAGLGWVFRPPDTLIDIKFTRLREKSDGISAEIHVTYNGEHMLHRMTNLLGATAIDQVAKTLTQEGGGTKEQWQHWLIVAYERTIRAYRRGVPAEVISGPVEPAAPVRMQCDPLVMADVTNTWVGSAGTGKSTFAKAYCVCHALGVHFLGHPVEQGVPMYLDYEDTRENFLRVVDHVLRGMDYTNRPTMLYRRMHHPLAHEIEAIAEEMDTHKVTLLIVDAVAAAGGAMTEWGGWENVALGIEQALLILPPVTVILLDHGTGHDGKDNSVPLRARGASRKFEFTRYQWSMVADPDEGKHGRHVVGWTHTKSNLTGPEGNFAVTVIHEQDHIAFAEAQRSSVAALQKTLRLADRAVVILEEAGGEWVPLKDITIDIHGDDDPKKRTALGTALRREAKRNPRLIQSADGFDWKLALTDPPLRFPKPYAGDDDD